MRGKSFLAGAGLVLIVVLAYLPALGARSIWDDDSYLIDNLLLRSVPGLIRIWTTPAASPQYYPVVFTSFWLEYHLWGMNLTGYHAVNVLLHAANAILLWRLLRVLQVPGAWMAAAVFGLHPVHVESVAWITERKNVLSGLFYLSALTAYLRFLGPLGSDTEEESAGGATRSPASEGHRWAWYALAFACHLGALGSKTVTSSLPAAILLILWWKRGRLALRDLYPLVPFFAAGALAGSLTAWMETYHVGARGPDWAFSTTERCLIAGRALWFYAGKLVRPVNLIFIYPRWRINAADATQYLYPAAVILVVITLWAFRRRLGRGPVVAVCYFCGTLVPALGFFNVYPMRFSFVADHFQYLASLGLIVLLTAVAAQLLAVLRFAPWGKIAVGATVLFVLGMLSLTRTPAFYSKETIWRNTLAKNPTCWIAHNNLGQIFRDRRLYAEARREFESAVELKPDYIDAHYNLGAVFEEQGDFDAAERELYRAMALEPLNWKVHFVLGLVRQKQGRLRDAAEAFRATLQSNPGYRDAQTQLELVDPGARLGGSASAPGGAIIGGSR